MNFNKWSQLLYPAASACYAYEPTNLKDGEVLADRFKAHNWALPTSGILARLFWLTYDGKGNSTAATAKEDSPLRTIFDNNGKMLFKTITKMYFWSVTEAGNGSCLLLNIDSGNMYTSSKMGAFGGRAITAF